MTPIDSLVTDAGRQILTAGLLGALLIVVAIVAGLVIRFLYKECAEERKARAEESAKFYTVTQKMVAVMEDTNNTGMERTKAIEALSQNIARQADAFSALANVHTVQFDRILDRFDLRPKGM